MNNLLYKEKNMSVVKNNYGTLPDGREVYEFVLSNGFVTAHIINYGGIVTKLITKDKNNNDVDVVLGRASMEEYLENDGCLGAAIGRFGNRIRNGEFEIDGITYHVGKNKNGNSLHGGFIGFDKKLWEGKEVENENAVILSYTSVDGEEGFPGNMDVDIKYSVTDENGLKIEYFAKSDKDTVCNLTNHSYFNLNGYKSGKIYDHKLQMNSRFFTPNDDMNIPVGEVLSVVGTPFDFTEEKRLGDGMTSDYLQVARVNGFDHNFVLDGTGLRLCATVTGDKTGIVMQVFTNQHGVQLYTANMLESANKGDYENGVHDGLCLETQTFPDCVHYSHFPTALLRKGEEYYHITEYRFV